MTTTQLATVPTRRAPPIDDDPFFLEHEVAQRYRVAVKTVRNWRALGKGPDYVKIEGAVRYRLSALEIYDKHRTTYTSEGAHAQGL